MTEEEIFETSTRVIKSYLQDSYPEDNTSGIQLQYNHHVTTDIISKEDIKSLLTFNELNFIWSVMPIEHLIYRIMNEPVVTIYIPEIYLKNN